MRQRGVLKMYVSTLTGKEDARYSLTGNAAPRCDVHDDLFLLARFPEVQPAVQQPSPCYCSYVPGMGYGIEDGRNCVISFLTWSILAMQFVFAGFRGPTAPSGTLGRG